MYIPTADIDPQNRTISNFNAIGQKRQGAKLSYGNPFRLPGYFPFVSSPSEPVFPSFIPPVLAATAVDRDFHSLAVSNRQEYAYVPEALLCPVDQKRLPRLALSVLMTELTSLVFTNCPGALSLFASRMNGSTVNNVMGS